MKSRILFILADLEAGGAQRVILNVIRYLDKNSFDPHLGIINTTGPMAKDVPENANIYNFKANQVRYAFPEIIRLCRSLNPQKIISTLPHLNLSLLAGRFLLPSNIHLVIREANIPSIRLKHTAHPTVYRILFRWLYPKAETIVCNSDYMKKDLHKNFAVKANRVTVIQNPVDSKKIESIIRKSPNPYSSISRTSLSVGISGPNGRAKDGARHLVAVGRLNYQKGLDLLLKAYHSVLEKISNLHLTIVGDGNEEDSLKALVSNLGIRDSVTFAGHQNNPFSFMAHADLFVSSSRWEGSPNAVLESLACGTPVVAFDSSGGTGEIIKNGENGWLVPHLTWEALSENIVDLIQSEAWKNLKAGPLLPDKHRLSNVVKRYEELLMAEV